MNTQSIYGPPNLRDITEGTCNLHHCSVTKSVPKLNQQKAHKVVQLMGIGTIHENNCILPMSSQWVLLTKNDTSPRWEPISVLNCEQCKGIWLYLPKHWDPDTYNLVHAKNSYAKHIWYVGRGQFCWEGIENTTFQLYDHYCAKLNLKWILVIYSVVWKLQEKYTYPRLLELMIILMRMITLIGSLKQSPPTEVKIMEDDWPEDWTWPLKN